MATLPLFWFARQLLLHFEFCSSVDAIEAYGNRDRKGRIGRLARVTGDVYVVLNMASIIVAGADPNRVSAEPPAALQTAYVISKL